MEPNALSIVIPSLGAPTLERTLRSIVEAGVRPDDEVVIVGDTLGATPSSTDGSVLERIWQAVQAVFDYGQAGRLCGVTVSGLAAYAHLHGNPQRQRAIELATKPWIVGQDEDDVFTPGAFEKIRDALEPMIQRPRPQGVLCHYSITWPVRPVIFCFECLIRPTGGDPYRLVLPRQGRNGQWVVSEAAIDGHSLVYPNDPTKLGRWTDRYESDWDFMHETLRRYEAGGEQAFYSEDIIGVARPHQPPYSKIVTP